MRIFCSEILITKANTNVKLYYILCGGLHAVLITFLNEITLFEGFASVLYFVELFIFAFVMLGGNIVKKVFACALPMFTTLAISFIMINYISSINNMTIPEIVTSTGYARLSLLLSVQILYYIMLKLLLKLFRTDDSKFSIFDWSVIIAVMVVSITLAGIIHSISIKVGIVQIRNYVNAAILVLLMLNILIYHLINSVSNKNKLEKELELIKIQEYYQRQYIESSKLQYDSIRKIKHDTQNHLLTICELISDNDVDSAFEFAKKNIENLELSQTYVKTENKVVNAVINSKLSSAAAMGIQVSCLSTNTFDGIDDIDLCNLLGNTLDNAISACRDQPENEIREINVKINREDEIYYTFIVRNTISKSVIKNNPLLKTTKNDKANHGYGTQIVKDISNKYGGRIDYYEEYDMFCCQVNLIAKSKASD